MTAVSLAGLAALLALLAGYVWRARPASAVNRGFAALTLALAGWVTGIAGLHTPWWPQGSSALTFISSSMLPPAFLFFARNYPVPAAIPITTAVRAVFAVGLVFAVLVLATPLIVHDVALGPAGPTRKSGILYPVFAGYILAGCLAPLSLVGYRWRHTRGQSRAQLHYLAAGLLILFLGAATSNLLIPLLLGSSRYIWLGPYFVLPLVALTAHAIIRHRLLDLRLIVHRGLAMFCLVVALATTGLIAGRLIFASWQVEPLFGSYDLMLVVVCVLLALSQPIYRVIGWLVDTYFYRGASDHQLALQNAAQRLNQLMEPHALVEEIRALLAAAVHPATIALAVAESESSRLELLDTDHPTLVALMDSSNDLRDFLAEPRRSSMVFASSEATMPARLADQLHTIEVDVLIVLSRRDQTLGAVFLGPRRSGEAYFAKDLAFLESLAQLASIAIENALLYRQRIQMLEYSARLLDSLTTAVVAIDREGRITSYNTAALDLFSLPSLDRAASIDALPSQVAWALAFAVREVSDAREVEVTLEHPLRGEIPLLLSSTVVHTPTRDVLAAIVVATDMSAVKTLERHQRRIDHLSSMARFYAGIAHEIRSPLSSISNFTAMLADHYDDAEFRDIAARLLPSEVGRIARLADRLRLMAPSEGGTLAPVDLAKLLRDIVTIQEPSAKDHGVGIRLRSPATLPRVQGDSGQLVQLLLNLINNAVEAMQEGGEIVVEAIAPDISRGADSITVTITDQGPGIPSDLRAKIFEPFFTTKASGTGLGLSICKEIVEFHRASLTLLPGSSGKGVTAELKFPILVDGNGVDDIAARLAVPTIQEERNQ